MMTRDRKTAKAKTETQRCALYSDHRLYQETERLLRLSSNPMSELAIYKKSNTFYCVLIIVITANCSSSREKVGKL